MDIYLHISCSTNNCLIVLSRDENLIDFIKIESIKLSEDFIYKLDQLLQKNNIMPTNIKEIYLDIGPGNNIGIRISTLSIYPFALINNIQIKTFSIIDISENYNGKVFIFKSGKNSLIYIKYDQKIYKTNIESINKILEKINPKSKELISNFEINLEGCKTEKIEISPENIIKSSIKTGILSENNQIESVILTDEIL